MQFDSLEQWLDWQTRLHPQAIELGLERCRQVALNCQLLSPSFPILTVAGTNGKGSTVTYLDALFSHAGLRTGRYTSPHLLCYNERICIAGQEVSDSALCQAFAFIESHRQGVSLTFFEYGTLAALYLFQQAQVEVAILEVGLGGRLDAVNLFDSSVALITCIDLDHTEYLGTDREAIGREKAGILRAQRPAICSDPNPPHSVLEMAASLETPLYCLGRDFGYVKTSPTTWNWWGPELEFRGLPVPSLKGEFQLANASGAILGGCLLSDQLFLTVCSKSVIENSLPNLQLPARFEVFPGTVTHIFDVAHNLAGARVLRDSLRELSCTGMTHAVVGILKDKKIMEMLAILQHEVQVWHVAPVQSSRSASPRFLKQCLVELEVAQVQEYLSISDAYEAAQQQVVSGDRIVVWGSFYGVAEIYPDRCGKL